MTLHRRLVIAMLALAAILLGAGVSILAVQRHTSITALDEQVRALASNPRAVVALANRADARPGIAEAFGDVYVGRLLPGGRLVTLLAPADDPELVPRLRAQDTLTEPVGRGTVSGSAQRVRVVAVPLGNGAEAVIAVPTTKAEAATARLARTLALTAAVLALALGLIWWWVSRLGLRPIEEMTAAADAIAAGDRDRRVPPGPAGTEAARLGSALNTMIDRTQAGEERMRRFVADASHELRTPLTTLRGYSSLHSADPEVGDAMRRMNSEATRMGGLVDDLLTLTNIDEHSLSVSPVDLTQVLADAAADAAVVAPDRSISVAAPDHLIISGDRDRLHQAVMALVTNALRHTPGSAAITLRAARADGGACVEVVDSGPGIAPEHLPHLFDRFYRADPGRSAGGSGLGLAVVAAIVDAHHGRYAVQSTPGAGATFTLWLPETAAPDGGSPKG